jgi:hypothetical protein
MSGLPEVLIDELLVGLIDERGEEEDRGGNQGKAPVGNDLDEVVGDESTKSGLASMTSCQSRHHNLDSGAREDEKLTAPEA